MSATLLFIGLLVISPLFSREFLKFFLWRSPNQFLLVAKSFLLGEIMAFIGSVVIAGVLSQLNSPNYPQLWVLTTVFFIVFYVLFSNTNISLRRIPLLTISLMAVSYSISRGVFSVVQYRDYLSEVFISGLFLAVLLRGVLWLREAHQTRT